MTACAGSDVTTEVPAPDEHAPDQHAPDHGSRDHGVPVPVDAEDFKAVFRRHPAGVAVITARSGDRLVGFTATSVISVSAEPPILAFSIDSGSSSWSALAAAETVVINFLAARQVDMSARFATSGIDRFADGGWSILPSGEPVLDGTTAWLRGEIIQRTPVGRSFLVAVQVQETGRRSADEPLVYHDRAYHAVGSRTAV